MSIGVLNGIAKAADYDMRLVLKEAGFHVPIFPVKIPDIQLPKWRCVLYPQLIVKDFQIDWYAPIGLSIFTNTKTQVTQGISTHTDMMISVFKDGKQLYRGFHPDYFEACACGCGFNTKRWHKRILPRAIPRSFSKDVRHHV
jgi:hypothetical protein